MGATLATLSAILKDLYMGPVTEQLNNDLLLLQRLDRGNFEIVGNRVVVPLHTNRSNGVGARAENEALPTPGNQVFADAFFDLKSNYGVIEVTGQAKIKTKSDAGSFLRAFELEMEGVLADLKFDVARQLYGDSTGSIAQCGVTAASTTLVLGGTNPTESLVKGQLYVGMTIDIGTLADRDVVSVSARTITTVNEAAGTVVISGAAVTTDATHFVTRAGTAIDGGTTKEIDGLQALVPTAANTFGTINASTNSFWDNQRDTGANLSLSLLQRADNKVHIKGGQPSVKITSFGIQNQYYALLQPQVRFADPMSLQAGFQTLTHNNLPIIADRLAPWGRVFTLDERFIKIGDNEDWTWLDDDGDVIKWKSGFDAWQAVIARYMNLTTNRRNVQHVLSGLTDNGIS